MGPLYHFISGTQVTQVSATDEESNNILYEIGPDGAGKFNINSATGWITSKVVIDREVCILYLKGPLSRIYQNSNDGNRLQIEWWNIKYPSKHEKKVWITHKKCEKGGTDGQTWRRLKSRGVLNKFLYGEAQHRGPTPYPFIYHFSRKRCPFRIPSIDKWYPFHIPCLELCIRFNCCKCAVF